MDHDSLRAMLDSEFQQVSLIQAHSADAALELLRSSDVDLLLVNRILDRDQSDGLSVIKRVKANPELATTPCMLISNFEESQQQAVDAGAEVGFGKQQLRETATRQLLARFLG